LALNVLVVLREVSAGGRVYALPACLATGRQRLASVGAPVTSSDHLALEHAHQLAGPLANLPPWSPEPTM